MSEFDLTPPEPGPTLVGQLHDLSVEIVWNKEDRDWRFIGLVTDWTDEPATLAELLQDEDANLLTSRDRDTVLRIVNEAVLPGDCFLHDTHAQDVFSYYTDSPHSGPSINIKLHDTYDFWRVVEKAFDFDFPEDYEIDPSYTIWSDTIDWEWEYYMETVIPQDHPALDTNKFMRLGRSGGHLVYDVVGAGLSVPEAWDFMQLEKVAPTYVRYVAAEIVRNQAAYALYEHWLEELEEWRERESDAVAEAVRTNDFRAAAWHQANLDAAKDRHFLGLEDAQELVSETLPE